VLAVLKARAPSRQTLGRRCHQSKNSYSSTQKRRTCSLTVTPTAAGTYNVPFTATRSGELPVQVVVSIAAT
jgi:hypothetical protein